MDGRADAQDGLLAQSSSTPSGGQGQLLFALSVPGYCAQIWKTLPLFRCLFSRILSTVIFASGYNLEIPCTAVLWNMARLPQVAEAARTQGD